jgi:hypothetical protein
MCVVCVTVAGTVLAASQLAPVELLNDFTSSNRTLSSFSSGSSSLSVKLRNEVKSFVAKNPDAQSATCTGLVLKGASKSTVSLAKKRATAACSYVKTLEPGVSTKVATKTTSVRSYAGRVMVTLRTPVEEVISVPIAKPVVRANPFETPFPEVFSRSEMVSAALDNLEKYISANASSKSFELVIHPDHQASADSIRYVFGRAYDALPFPVGYQKTIAVVSNDRAFTDKAVSDFGFSRHDVNGCLNCAGEGWSNTEFGNAWQWVGPHEVFHVWQRSAYQRKGNNNPDPNRDENAPVWMDEGGAEWFGYAMYSLQFSRSRYPGLNGYERGWLPLTSYRSRDVDPMGPYTIGRAATEYIVASVGVDRYFQIYRNVGLGQSFPDAFASATGISLASFYEKFDRLQSNIGR